MVVCLMDQSVRPYRGQHFRYVICGCSAAPPPACSPPASAPAAPLLVVHILIDTLIVFAARDFVLCAVHAYVCQGGSWDERDSSVGLLEVSGRGVKQLLK